MLLFVTRYDEEIDKKKRFVHFMWRFCGYGREMDNRLARFPNVFQNISMVCGGVMDFEIWYQQLISSSNV